MKQNIYNNHAFTETEKMVKKAIKELEEELKSYSKWFKTVGNSFDAYQPHFYFNAFEKVAKQLIDELKLVDNFVGEVFSARLKDLP